MITAVRYYTQAGNTQKPAEANSDKIGEPVNVSTTALIESACGQMKLAARPDKLWEREFRCRGKFMAPHAGHPDAENLKAARKFAGSVIA